MNCCGNSEVSDRTFSLMMESLLEYFTPEYLKEALFTDSFVYVLFSLHVVAVVAFLFSHCAKRSS